MLVNKIFAETATTLGNEISKIRNPKTLEDVIKFIKSLQGVALDIVGMLAVIMITWAAFGYALSHGDDTKAETSKKTILLTFWGIFLVALAYFIAKHFQNSLQN